MRAKPTILVVEKVSQDLESIIQMIGWEQYDVIGADNFDAATRHLAMPVDLVISDLEMGQPDAMQFLQYWQRQLPTVPLILVTDFDHVEAAAEALRFGATDYIIKPVHPEELRVRIARWLSDAHKFQRQFEPSLSNADELTGGSANGIRIPPGTSLEELERAAVEKALEQHQGNRTHAARVLGISVRTLQRKLKAWRISNRAGQGRPLPHNFLHVDQMPGAFATHAH